VHGRSRLQIARLCGRYVFPPQQSRYARIPFQQLNTFFLEYFPVEYGKSIIKLTRVTLARPRTASTHTTLSFLGFLVASWCALREDTLSLGGPHSANAGTVVGLPYSTSQGFCRMAFFHLFFQNITEYQNRTEYLFSKRISGKTYLPQGRALHLPVRLYKPVALEESPWRGTWGTPI